MQRYGVFSYPPNVSKEKFAKTGSFSRYLTKNKANIGHSRGKGGKTEEKREVAIRLR